jgi:hypothetical protein
METERIMDCRRQLVGVDAAGLGQIAFAQCAGERLRSVPELQREGVTRRNVMLLFG